MIRNSKQQWEVSQTVKVGFLSLIVRAKVATPGDGAPDAYILANAAATQLYKFVPHHGVEKISTSEARLLVANARYRIADLTRGAMEHLQACNQVSREIEAIFAPA